MKSFRYCCGTSPAMRSARGGQQHLPQLAMNHTRLATLLDSQRPRCCCAHQGLPSIHILLVFCRRLECYRCCVAKPAHAATVTAQADAPSHILKVSGLEQHIRYVLNQTKSGLCTKAAYLAHVQRAWFSNTLTNNRSHSHVTCSRLIACHHVWRVACMSSVIAASIVPTQKAPAVLQAYHVCSTDNSCLH